jgi:energy-coupling factor transport system ATP-binding protein
MARHLIPKAVTVADIISCCGGKLPAEPEIPEATALPEPKTTAVNFKPKPLPLWRKIIAGISLTLAMLVFFIATSATDLSKLINAEGIHSGGYDQLKLYIVLIAALGIFIAAIGRRSTPSAMMQIPSIQRKLTKRTLVATVLTILFIPLTIFASVMYFGNKHYNITAFLVLFECMLPFFLVFESRKPKARELVTIAVLCAIGVAGRSAFFMLPQFKPVLALVIISGVAFGGETGFLVGAVTMMVSNVLFSQGPWMPWQMFSMGIIGFLAGVCFRKGLLRRSRGSLATFGAFAAVIIYGGIMNPAAALMYNSQSINLKMLMAYYISGLPMDLIHAAATVIFILIAAEPMLEKLDRIKVKYGLVE